MFYLLNYFTGLSTLLAQVEVFISITTTGSGLNPIFAFFIKKKIIISSAKTLWGQFFVSETILAILIAIYYGQNRHFGKVFKINMISFFSSSSFPSVSI